MHGNIHTSVYVSALRHTCWEGVSREPQRAHDVQACNVFQHSAHKRFFVLFSVFVKKFFYFYRTEHRRRFFLEELGE